MKVCFLQSGGFAGLRMGVELDSETLPPAEAQALRQLVVDAGFFEHQQTTGPAIPDDEIVKLEISDGGRNHQIVASRKQLPKGMAGLVTHLSAKSSYLKR